MYLLNAITNTFPTVISIVGAGGKTSALLRLGRELSEMKRTTILTTSTHLGTDQLRGHPVICSESDRPLRSPQEVLTAANDLINRARVIFVVSRVIGQTVNGLERSTIDHLAGHYDVVAVEADGARGRSLKAPAPEEPVWPLSTQLALAVVGIDALGKPLDESIAHRPQRIAELTGQRIGQAINHQTIVTCLVHPKGIFQGVPEAAARAVLINKVTSETLGEARSIARLLHSIQPTSRVIIGNVRPEHLELWP